MNDGNGSVRAESPFSPLPFHMGPRTVYSILTPGFVKEFRVNYACRVPLSDELFYFLVRNAMRNVGVYQRVNYK